MGIGIREGSKMTKFSQPVLQRGQVDTPAVAGTVLYQVLQEK